SIVNRGSAHSTPYRSPNSGNTYGQGTRGQQGTAVAPSQGNNAGRSQGSIGRNNSTRRQSTVTPQRQNNNNYNYNQNQNSNRQNLNQNQSFGSSTNRGSSFSSGSMGGGSRGGGAMGGGGGSRSSGSRGR
ncbi:MAG: hypothetical protein IKC66_03150, partial [Alistipes sp.]|nr:hypothetical protein [Alistipes sp.]